MRCLMLEQVESAGMVKPHFRYLGKLNFGVDGPQNMVIYNEWSGALVSYNDEGEQVHEFLFHQFKELYRLPLFD